MLEVQKIHFSDADKAKISHCAPKNRRQPLLHVLVNKIDGGTKIAMCKGKIAKYTKYDSITVF